MRLFIAVNLPAAEKHRLGTVLDQLRRSPLPVRWVAEDSLHITLKFLGDVTEQRRPDIDTALRAASHSVLPFEMRVAGLGTFPTRGRVRVLWIGVEAPPAMQELQQRLEEQLATVGFARENRDFHPHITLARTNSTARGADRAEVDRIAPDIVYNASIYVESIDLMRSHLSARGARYERMTRVVLGGTSE